MARYDQGGGCPCGVYRVCQCGEYDENNDFIHPKGNVIFTDKWVERFLGLALYISMWSKDPSTKVGAVIVRDDKTIVSTGYNGFPRGCNDDQRLYNDRDEKYPRIVHAELNAILSSYAPVRGNTIFVTHMPCCECSKAIIQSGIKRVYCIPPGEALRERFKSSFEHAERMFQEAGVKLSLRHK